MTPALLIEHVDRAGGVGEGAHRGEVGEIERAHA